MTLFIIFRIIGYSVIIYDIILFFFSTKKKKKNAIYAPRYIIYYALWFFLCFSIIFIMSFNYQRSNNYGTGAWISGIAYLLATGGVGTFLLMFLGNWKLLIFDKHFEYYNILGRKKIIKFCDIDKEKSFYSSVKKPCIHIECNGNKTWIQNWYMDGDFLLLFRTLKKIGIQHLEK